MSKIIIFIKEIVRNCTKVQIQTATSICANKVNHMVVMGIIIIIMMESSLSALIYFVFRWTMFAASILNLYLYYNLYQLSSADGLTLLVPATRRSTLGERAFPVASARAWNALPSLVRTAQSLNVFCRELKTVLFGKSFP